MPIRPGLAIFAGAVLVAAGGYTCALYTAPDFVAPLTEQAQGAIATVGSNNVSARFRGPSGSPSRHPVLTGGAGLDEKTRSDIAHAVASVPGVGGVVWSDGTSIAESNSPTYEPLHCQEDVEGLLRSRSVRFEEASSALEPASQILLDEVADALRPCLGSIISITGHTDNSGTKPGNLQLSMERARAVRENLIERGIPRDGMRASGVGSASPVEGLAPDDPANRRIEFAVIRTEPLKPTPVDTPGPR